MPSLILKKYKTSDKVELSFESVVALTVQDLEQKVSSSVGLAADGEFSECCEYT